VTEINVSLVVSGELDSEHYDVSLQVEEKKADVLFFMFVFIGNLCWKYF
jgi:Ni,Fe-hydrogenase III small subunit